MFSFFRYIEPGCFTYHGLTADRGITFVIDGLYEHILIFSCMLHTSIYSTLIYFSAPGLAAWPAVITGLAKKCQYWLKARISHAADTPYQHVRGHNDFIALLLFSRSSEVEVVTRA